MARNILEIIGGQILSSSSAVASYPMRGLWRWDERRAGPKGHAGCEIPQRGPLHWKRSGRRDYRASQTRSEVYDEAEEAAGSARSLRTSPCPDSEAPPRRGRRLPPTPPPPAELPPRRQVAPRVRRGRAGQSGPLPAPPAPLPAPLRGNGARPGPARPRRAESGGSGDGAAARRSGRPLAFSPFKSHRRAGARSGCGGGGGLRKTSGTKADFG